MYNFDDAFNGRHWPLSTIRPTMYQKWYIILSRLNDRQSNIVFSKIYTYI